MPAIRSLSPDHAAPPTARNAPLLRCIPAPTTVALGWLLLVVAGQTWQEVAPVGARLATLGEIVLLTLALHALHEAGHVVAGLLVGVPFSRVTLAAVAVTREEQPSGWCVRWGLNREWHKVAGCVERELTPAPGIRRALTVTALGGPVASVLGGLLLVLAPGMWHGLGQLSILLGFANALPLMILGQASDGMIVWRLWSRDPAHVAWRAQFCEPERGEAPG